MKALLQLFVLVFAITPAVTSACSVVRNYKVPTSLELAEKADTIVLARVIGEVPGKEDWNSNVAVKPVELIKGATMPEQLMIFGRLSDARWHPTRSDPHELRAPNPDAMMGGCTRYIFDKDMLLLLFFERDENGELRFAGYPFARVSEDVPSADALWVKAVKVYVAFAALPRNQRRAAIIARRDALAKEDNVESKALAADLDVELRRRRTPPFD